MDVPPAPAALLGFRVRAALAGGLRRAYELLGFLGGELATLLIDIDLLVLVPLQLLLTAALFPGGHAVSMPRGSSGPRLAWTTMAMSLPPR